MTNVNELPQLTEELIDLSKEYLRQETVGHAQRLGKVAGFSMGAAMLFSIGVILLATAGMRFLVEVLPEGGLWTALALFISALIAGGAAGTVAWRASS